MSTGQQPPSWAQPPQNQPQPTANKPGCGKIAGIGCLGLVGLFILFIVISAVGAAISKSGSSPPAKPAPASRTVTYIVTGAKNADIQYGPAGSSAQGHAPMNITKPLDNAQFYSISAQLQGDGDVTCQIQVDGTTISQAQASGGYNIASCEISKDPFSGNWVDTNKG